MFQWDLGTFILSFKIWTKRSRSRPIFILILHIKINDVFFNGLKTVLMSVMFQCHFRSALHRVQWTWSCQANFHGSHEHRPCCKSIHIIHIFPFRWLIYITADQHGLRYRLRLVLQTQWPHCTIQKEFPLHRLELRFWSGSDPLSLLYSFFLGSISCLDGNPSPCPAVQINLWGLG